MLPASSLALMRSRKEPEFTLPISSLKLTHKYVAPCTNEEGERGRGVEVVKLPLLEKKHEEENRVRSPVWGEVSSREAGRSRDL